MRISFFLDVKVQTFLKLCKFFWIKIQKFLKKFNWHTSCSLYSVLLPLPKYFNTMKRLFAALIISLVVLSAFGQEHLKVKGVPIDGSVDSFITKMKAAGLTYNSKFSDAVGYPVMDGDFAGLTNCHFSVLYTKNKTVCKVLITSDDIGGWYSTKSKYNDLKELLGTKYELMRSFEYFSKPYYEGDGYELSAVRQDKCTYKTFFHCDEGYVTVAISASGSSTGYLTIVYEDTINTEKYSAEREKQISSDI